MQLAPEDFPVTSSDLSPGSAQPQREFKRELKLLDSTMIVVGSMIGSGIFIVSADIARTVGSPGYLLLVWLITGIVTIIGALSYGELAGMMPHAGGQYVYLREAYNPMVGFLYGWTLILVIQTGTIAAVCVAFSKFTAVFFPQFREGATAFSLFGFKVGNAQLLSIACIILLTYINSRGIHGGKIIQNLFTVAKTTALLALIVLGFAIGRNPHAVELNLANFWNASWTHMSGASISTIEQLSLVGLLAAIGVSMVGSLFSSDAWNNITFAAAEVVNPKKTIPLSLVFGTGAVTLLYLLANVAYILILPVNGTPGASDVVARGIQFAADDRVGTAAASMIFGAPAAFIMAALIMVSTFGCTNGLILSGARVYYAMAKDRLFFSKVGTLNSKSVPGFALAIQGVWASALCLSGTYGDLLDYVIFAVLVFYILTVAGIFILRKRRPDAERPYRAFGYPIVPALYILAATAICIDLLIFKPNYTWPGMLIVLLGIPAYYFWRLVGESK
jgi:APA family basic amino acid/polyamine antiporter